MRRDAVASQASRNAAGVLGKPPCGSRIPASRCVEDPRRWDGIAFKLTVFSHHTVGRFYNPGFSPIPLTTVIGLRACVNPVGTGIAC